MKSQEVALLRRMVAGKRRIVEFGCGGSTLILLEQGAHVTSVENDPRWIEHLAGDEMIQEGLYEGRLRFLYIDLGTPKLWGFPRGEARVEWAEYWREVWTRAQDVDLVLVDGRFRVACALSAALYGGDPLICVHDYFRRDKYHVLENHLTLLPESEGQLAIFQKPPCVRWDEGRATLELGLHAFDPA